MKVLSGCVAGAILAAAVTIFAQQNAGAGELPVTNYYVKGPWTEDKFAEVVGRPGNRAEGKELEYTADEGSTRRRNKTPNIPPYVGDWHLTGIAPLTEDITLYAMSPHMHLRGKS